MAVWALGSPSMADRANVASSASEAPLTATSTGRGPEAAIRKSIPQIWWPVEPKIAHFSAGSGASAEASPCHEIVADLRGAPDPRLGSPKRDPREPAPPYATDAHFQCSLVAMFSVDLC